jgi:hypothetical protein
MSRSILARAFLLTLAAAALLIAYGILLPNLPPGERERVDGLAPWAPLIGVAIGVAIWVIDRLSPRLFRNVSTGTLLTVPWLILGATMWISEGALSLIAVGMAGSALPVATPLARFPSR